MKKIMITALLTTTAHAHIDTRHLAQADAHYNSKHPLAQAQYKSALNSDPSIVQHLAQLGHALQRNGNYTDAIALYNTALDINNSYINIYSLLAESYQAVGNQQEAERVYETALKRAPQHTPLLISAARFFNQIKQHKRALDLAHKAAATTQNSLEIQLLIGRIYNDQGSTNQAIEAYRTAARIAPNSFHAHYNLGFALKICGHLKEAQQELRRAAELAPQEHVAHIGLAHAYWADGQLMNAWKEFEHRWHIVDASKGLRPQDLTYPLWNTAIPLKDKTVLMYSEQGLGDTLQFIRFAQEIKKRGGKTVCAVQKPLRTLLKQCPYIDHIMEDKQAMCVDYQAPLMSMPYLLKLEKIEPCSTYLHADKKLVEEWRGKLNPQTFNIGICWEVDLQHDQIKSSPLEWRSVPLKELAPLAHLPNITFYSLQKINGEDQLKNLPDKFIVHTFDGDFDTSHGRFMDTAAVVANLDLIISADTAIAHLAGGLGKPVWLMLPYSPECRWQFARSDSDWYPTMRIFRQTKPFGWSATVHEMSKALKTLVQSRHQEALQYRQQATQYHARADIPRALTCYNKALEITPHDSEIMHDIAFMHRLQGDMPAALTMLKRELAIRPHYPLAHVACAHAYWVLGDYKNAWKEREWRWHAKGFHPDKQAIPLLNKHAALKNKTVLLYAEDGLGDTIQFIRFAQLLKAQGAHIICEVQEPLIPLLRSSCPFIDTFSCNQLEKHLQNKSIDYQAPLMSLPHILHIDETNLPNKPYLTHNAPLAKGIRATLNPHIPNIGLCWHVEPKHEIHASPICKRAMRLADFAPFAHLKNVQFYSLHKQHDFNEIHAWQKKLNLTLFGPDFDEQPFIDTAALMQHLDLIITVDTSIAHLAGALGKKVWLLLPTSPDCRWQLKRTDCPWYPSMRIFRQQEYGNWQSVIKSVAQALIEEFPNLK